MIYLNVRSFSHIRDVFGHHLHFDRNRHRRPCSSSKDCERGSSNCRLLCRYDQFYFFVRSTPAVRASLTSLFPFSLLISIPSHSSAFDKFGRVLVKLDGTLSMMLIETEAYVKDIVDELDPKQPTFQWLFKLSFNWRIITSFHSLIAESIAARRAGKETGRAAPEPKGVVSRLPSFDASHLLTSFLSLKLTLLLFFGLLFSLLGLYYSSIIFHLVRPKWFSSRRSQSPCEEDRRTPPLPPTLCRSRLRALLPN